jgi:predicted esterase
MTTALYPIGRKRCVAAWACLMLLAAPPAKAAEVAAFDGEWCTSISTVHLKQTADRVTGTYSKDGEYTLEGRVEGNKLTFEFRKDRVKGAAHWTMDDSGFSFQGDCQPNGGSVGSWNGWRPDPQASQGELADSTGLWFTSLGLMELEQSGDKVQGRYLEDGVCSIEGSLTGRSLTFKYNASFPGHGWLDFSPGGATFAGAAVTDRFPDWHHLQGRRATEFVRHAKLEPGKIVDGSTEGLLTYSVRAPKGYAADSAKRWPAIVILHDRKTSGRDYVNMIAATWPDIARDYLLIGINGDLPWSSEQDPKFSYWYLNYVGHSTVTNIRDSDRQDPALLAEAMDELRETYPVARYFVGGHGEGGNITYSILMNFPEKIAGVFPVAASVIPQCEPTTFADTALRAAQRRVPLAIVYGRCALGFDVGKEATYSFGEASWPAWRSFPDKSFSERFDSLAVDEAIRWLEVQASDDPALLLDFAEQRFAAQEYRDAVTALNRIQAIGPGAAEVKRLERLDRRIDAKVSAGAAEFLPKIRAAERGETWIKPFLDYRDDFEFAPGAHDVMQAFAKLRAEHEGPAMKLRAEAETALRRGNRDKFYEKYLEIFERYYAATMFRDVNRELTWPEWAAPK